MRLFTNYAYFYTLSALLAFAPRSARAVVTFSDIRELTDVTWDACGHVDAEHCASPSGDGTSHELLRSLGVGAQQPFSSLEDDDLEHTVAASLRTLNSEIIQKLNVPLTSEELAKCSNVILEYHQFVSATVHFLRAIDEKQAAYRWDASSTVFDELGYLQALWASRRPNELHRSFIEQQLDLYKQTICFTGKQKNEVLTRSVEIVEFINDMLDTFN